jgi:hypothetical protein
LQRKGGYDILKATKERGKTLMKILLVEDDTALREALEE